ncbi:hypothetical protein ACQSIV_005024, partial [Escherichia coli]
MACQDLMIVIIINHEVMLHRSESLLTLWQHHSLGILWCNTKTGLSRNNRQCYGKSYRTEPQNISVPEMHKNTVHMFL